MHGWAAGSGPLPFAQSELAALGVTSTVGVGPATQKITGTPEGPRAVETEALAAAAEGRLVPAVHPFPLADTARAHAALESRATMGKVVLIP